jgi:hypothetical protein
MQVKWAMSCIVQLSERVSSKPGFMAASLLISGICCEAITLVRSGDCLGSFPCLRFVFSYLDPSSPGFKISPFLLCNCVFPSTSSTSLCASLHSQKHVVDSGYPRRGALNQEKDLVALSSQMDVPILSKNVISTTAMRRRSLPDHQNGRLTLPDKVSTIIVYAEIIAQPKNGGLINAAHSRTPPILLPCPKPPSRNPTDYLGPDRPTKPPYVGPHLQRTTKRPLRPTEPRRPHPFDDLRSVRNAQAATSSGSPHPRAEPGVEHLSSLRETQADCEGILDGEAGGRAPS